MNDPMILILAIIHANDCDDTISALTEKGFYVTVLGTTGGFLRQKNTTLLIGTYDNEREKVKAILREKAGLREEEDYSAYLCVSGSDGSMPYYLGNTPPLKRTVGGATAFFIQMDEIEKF